MKDLASCLSAADRPELERGQCREDGRFVRSLEHSGAPKRFERDGDPALYGYRVKPAEWRWSAEVEDDGLSVNLEACARTPLCALLFHPNSDRFEHVVIIDLAALAAALEMSIVAVFDPNPNGFENPCHWYLSPADVPVADLKMALKSWSRTVFDRGKEVPATPAAAAVAQEERARYQRVFDVRRDVREILKSAP